MFLSNMTIKVNDINGFQCISLPGKARDIQKPGLYASLQGFFTAALQVSVEIQVTRPCLDRQEDF